MGLRGRIYHEGSLRFSFFVCPGNGIGCPAPFYRHRGLNIPTGLNDYVAYGEDVLRMKRDCSKVGHDKALWRDAGRCSVYLENERGPFDFGQCDTLSRVRVRVRLRGARLAVAFGVSAAWALYRGGRREQPDSV